MDKVIVYLAHEDCSGGPSDGFEIAGKEEVPYDHGACGGVAGRNQVVRLLDIYAADAHSIVDCLARHLPGGTMGALLRVMLERRASQAVVSENFWRGIHERAAGGKAGPPPSQN